MIKLLCFNNTTPTTQAEHASNTGGGNPARTLSEEQMRQYRKHLELLKTQENELLESIRLDQEREEHSLLEEIRVRTEKLERLKASRPQASSAALPPNRQQNIQTNSEETRSAILNPPVPDSISTLLRRPLLAEQQQQQLSHNSQTGLLSGFSSGFAAASNPPLNPGLLNSRSQVPSLATHPISHNELFLRPTRANDVTKGKALRIVDFVSRIRPAEDEKVLSYDKNCKLALILQDTRPKLSSVTIEQYNIANLRIFYELLFSGKLSTLLDVQEYLSYAIKVLELATKNTWESVLKYDDEFRILQHTYGFSWSYDHSHLHEVVLEPRWAAKLPRGLRLSNDTSSSKSDFSFSSGLAGNNKGPAIMSHLSSGLEICRMFNSRRGCQKSPCKFAHACNRKVGSQVCGKSHQGFLHPVGQGDTE